MDEYLTRYRQTVSSAEYTHLNLSPRFKLSLKNEEIKNFWDCYCQSTGKRYLAERNVLLMPIVFEIEFKMACDIHDTDFSTPYIEGSEMDFVKTFQEILENSYEVRPRDLVCCLLESPKPIIKGNKMFYTMRFHFPYCRLNSQDQNSLIDLYVKKLNDKDYSEIFKFILISDWSKAVKSLADQPLTLYGSSANDKTEPLILTNIFGQIIDEDFATEEGCQVSLDKVFSPHSHKYFASCHHSVLDLPLKQLIPLFLSVHYFDVPDAEPSKKETNTGEHGDSLGSSLEKTAAQNLISIVGERRKNSIDWMVIGKALYTTYAGSKAGLDTWIRFSPDKEEECRSYYPTFDIDNCISWKTLAWFARKDNPGAYRRWHKNYRSAFNKDALNISTNSVAKALHAAYFLDFVCSSIKQNIWYRFSGNVWVTSEVGVDLSKTISEEFAKGFEALKIELASKGSRTDKPADKERYEAEEKKCFKLISKLRDRTFKVQVFKEATELFYDETFAKLLDSNRNLMGIKNGIIELGKTWAKGKRGKHLKETALVREGKPEDFISRASPVSYSSHLHKDHQVVAEARNYFRKVYPDKPVYHFVMKFFASCLRGGNEDKIFAVMSGGGNNSKSKVKEILQLIWDANMVDVPTSLLTGKKGQSGTASPELAQAKNARIMSMQEPNDDEAISNGTLKELTGGDSFYARLLHENGGSVKAQFKLILFCNNVPVIPYSDDASVDRIKIIPHVSTWVDDPPESEEEQFRQRRFKKDPKFGSKLPHIAPGLLWILINYYSKYLKEGLTPPKEVINNTEDYWKENDLYFNFSQDKIERINSEDGEPNKAYSLTLAEAYREFGHWMNEFNSQIKVPNRKTFEGQINKLIGKNEGKTWFGCRLKVEKRSGDSFMNF